MVTILLDAKALLSRRRIGMAGIFASQMLRGWEPFRVNPVCQSIETKIVRLKSYWPFVRFWLIKYREAEIECNKDS